MSLMTCCRLRLTTGRLPKDYIAFVDCFFTRNYANRLAFLYLIDLESVEIQCSYHL